MISNEIGYEKIIKQFSNAIVTDRIAGAYLFVGDENIGKEAIAIHIVKMIFNGSEIGDSPAVRKINDGNHPDFRIVRPDGTRIKIGQIRELQREIIFRPAEANRKVFLITDAERMNIEAANCLLKTLEEPPAGAVLILLTTNIETIIPTIRSRCQIITFQPQISADISDQIPEILTTTDPFHLFKVAEKISKEIGELDRLASWYRDLLLIREDVNIELLTHQNFADQLKIIAQQFSRRQLRSAIKSIFETKAMIDRNVNATLAIEVLALKLLPSSEA